MSQTVTLELANETYEALIQLANRDGATPAEWLRKNIQVLLSDQSISPLYRVHEQAVATGVPDLAEQHDHYLYGKPKSNG